MSNNFGKRTVFSQPFEAPVFEAPWGPGPRPDETDRRNIVYGSVPVAALNRDISTGPNLEVTARVADFYPLSTEG